MRLFGKERAAEQERREAQEAKDTLDGLGTLVGVHKPWSIQIQCKGCDQWMTQDPANTARFICAWCHGVLTLAVERRPDG